MCFCEPLCPPPNCNGPSTSLRNVSPLRGAQRCSETCTFRLRCPSQARQSISWMGLDGARIWPRQMLKRKKLLRAALPKQYKSGCERRIIEHCTLYLAKQCLYSVSSGPGTFDRLRFSQGWAVSSSCAPSTIWNPAPQAPRILFLADPELQGGGTPPAFEV